MRNCLPTGANAVLGLAAFTARTCSGDSSTYVPFTSLPGAVLLGSETASVASPAVLVTFAATEVTYSAVTPGMIGPSLAGPSIDSASVKGTVAPTSDVPVGEVLPQATSET